MLKTVYLLLLLLENIINYLQGLSFFEVVINSFIVEHFSIKTKIVFFKVAINMCCDDEIKQLIYRNDLIKKITKYISTYSDDTFLIYSLKFLNIILTNSIFILFR